jgi:dipeptidyl aminopeptidase/acylaminoacyl peptidase
VGSLPSRQSGPYPLIVFAHGYDSSPAVYASLLDAWASAGYVVAAPAFPRALHGAPLDEDDLANEPGDISFVIGRLLSAAAGPGPLAGLIDTSRIGVAGHSDGGVAALGVGFNACCRDGRVSAVMLGAADEQTFPSGSYFPPGSPPMLVIQGDHDPINPPDDSRQLFAAGRTPKYLLWLLDAGHLEPFSTDAAHLAVVEAVTIAFFDRYLKGEAAGVRRMQAGAVSGLATLTAG